MLSYVYFVYQKYDYAMNTENVVTNAAHVSNFEFTVGIQYHGTACYSLHDDHVFVC